MIKIYPSKLEGEPLETHPIDAHFTFDAWMTGNVKGYAWSESPPISAHHNGRLLTPDEWRTVVIGPGDVVCVYPEPKLAGTFLGISYGAWALAAAAVVLAIVLQPGIPKAGDGGGQRGRNIDEASAKGNRVKLNSTIREIFGRRRAYPDYLVPVHRYFAGLREQVIETHLCLGTGDFDLLASEIFIGDTPIPSLGENAEFQIYQPGADVSGDSRCEWWHSAPEVGSTASGTVGIDLTTTTELEQVAVASQFVLSGFNISIPAGAGEFPEGWEAGLIVRVEAQYPYTVTDGVGPGVRDIISGDIAQVALSAGDNVEIVGGNEGFYKVFAIDGGAGTLTLDYLSGDPADSLVTGAQEMGIGWAGLRYRITAFDPAFITLERLDDTGAVDASWPGFSDLTSNTVRISLDPSNTEGDWAGPFAACPEGEVTSRLEWDVFFPEGLCFFNKDGDVRPSILLPVEMQYRDIAVGGAWSSVIVTYREATRDQIGITETLDLPTPIRPEVRMRRNVAKNTNTRSNDKVQWYGLRAKLNGKTAYEGVTTLAVLVKGGGRLAAQAEQLVSAIPTRKLPTRVDGAWTGPVATRDIAPAVAYIAKSLGYTDADLDLDELDRLDAVWKARGETFDQVFEQPTTAKEAMNSALRAGMAELTIDRGLVRPVRDEPRAFFEHMYTPQNMTGPLKRQFQSFTPDDFDGVDVEYTSSRTWQVETVECRLPGDLGTRVEKISIEGVTSETQAWRIGMRQRRASIYRRFIYNFDTELDALNSRYMSYAALGDDVPGYNKSSILMDFAPMGASVLLRSSEPFDWSEPGDHMVAIRKKDGSLSGPYVATRVDDYRLTVPGPLDFTPDTSWDVEPPHLLFGPAERWTYPALITEINPSGRSGCSVVAVNYDERVYEDDDNSPPA